MAPGTGRKRRASARHADDDDDVQPTQGRGRGSSQGARHPYFDPRDEEHETFGEEIRRYNAEAESAVESTKLTLSTTEEERLVRDVMRFMIFKQQAKSGVPVSRAELAKLFPQNRKGATNMVIKLAQAKFPDLMGLEMKEMRIATGKAPVGSDEGNKWYILRSLLPAVVRMTFLNLPSVIKPAESAFEVMVLALIVMNGERISEEDLWRLLEDVGISKGAGQEDLHPTFGKKPEEHIKQMVQKRYLKAHKGRGDAGMTYEWGPNAEDEIGRSKVDDYIRQTIEGDNND